MTSKAAKGKELKRGEWLNVGQINGRTAGGLFCSLDITCHPRSLPSSLPDTRRSGMFGRGRKEKEQKDEWPMQCWDMVSWDIWSKPSKMEGQAVARMCCEKERALWLISSKRVRPVAHRCTTLEALPSTPISIIIHYYFLAPSQRLLCPTQSLRGSKWLTKRLEESLHSSLSNSMDKGIYY